MALWVDCCYICRSGAKYSSRFNTTVGYNTVRLPYNTFRPLDFNDPPVDPEQIQHMSFKFEPRKVGLTPPLQFVMVYSIVVVWHAHDFSAMMAAGWWWHWWI